MVRMGKVGPYCDQWAMSAAAEALSVSMWTRLKISGS
jgi:hypothetical protein